MCGIPLQIYAKRQLSVDVQHRVYLLIFIHNRIRKERSESVRERRIELYKTNNNNNNNKVPSQCVQQQNLARKQRQELRTGLKGQGALRASLSGTLLQTLPDLVTPLKGHFLSPRSCPAMRSAPSERFDDCRSNLAPKHARKHETHPPLVRKRVPSRFKRLWFYLCWCKLCWRL